jgi:hypothetical protein
MVSYMLQPLYPGERDHSTCYAGGRTGSLSSLYLMVQRKISALAGNETLVIQPLIHKASSMFSKRGGVTNTGFWCKETVLFVLFTTFY